MYEVDGSSSPAGVYLLNADLSYVYSNVARNAGVATFGSGGTTTGQSPYRIGVSADDSVIVGDASLSGAAVYQIDPNFTTNQLLLGPVGDTNGLAAGSHGTIESRPLLLGSIANSNAILYQIDGEMVSYNSLLIYNIGAGPLPWTNPPTTTASEIGLDLDSIALGGNEFPGLTRGPNGYLYCSTYREDLSNPSVQVYSADGRTNLWNSWLPDQTPYPGGTPSGDYFLLPIQGLIGGIVDSAVSPDGNYLIALNIYNGVVVCPLTNGIPDPGNMFAIPATGTNANARGIAWDAALNYYVSSSGLGVVQEWSLGFPALAVTRGDATGQTNFSLLAPPWVVVNSAADNGAGTLRDAINNAPAGSIITFAPNLSGQTITLSNTLAINTSLTIDASALPGGIQINGNGSVQIFNVASNNTVVLNSLTITNGNAVSGYGGGVYNGGTLTVNQCTLTGNGAAFFGGGIYNGGTLTLNQCTLSGNNASAYNGGGIYNDGILTVNQCTLSGNSVDFFSGGGAFPTKAH